MTTADKERISKALRDYTAKITQSPKEAKDALEREGIFQADGQLSVEYRDTAAA